MRLSIFNLSLYVIVLAYVVLRLLNWKHIGQILLLEPFPSTSKVCSLILQEEKRKSFGHGVNVVYPTEATVMFATHAKGFNGNQG